MRRLSSRLLAAGVAIAIGAFAATMYRNKLQRDFSGPKAIAIGTVVNSGALYRPRRSDLDGLFCWVKYRFSIAGGVSRTGWRMWHYGCGIKRGADISIEYVVASPETHRPHEAAPPVPPLFLWFTAGVVTVVGMLRRGSAMTDGDE